MTRVLGFLSVLLVVLLAMAFAAANAGYRTTLSLGFVTLYQIPVSLVAFVGLLVGMVVMVVAGIRSDLKVRRILRARLAEESRREQTWIDRNQGDLFAGPGSRVASVRVGTGERGLISSPPTDSYTPPVSPEKGEGASSDPGGEEPARAEPHAEDPGKDSLPRDL